MKRILLLCTATIIISITGSVAHAKDGRSVPLPIVKVTLLDKNKLRERADAGEGELWPQLARLYVLAGQGYQAREAAAKAAKTGLAAGVAFDALDRFITAKEDGEKTEAAKEVKKAWTNLKIAADGGNAEAMNVIGEVYQRGWQTIADPPVYREFFGSVLADPEPDLHEAVKWYTKSAESGNPFGRLALGRLYFTGQGVKEDGKAAEKLFRQADPVNGLAWGLIPLAEKGHAKAQMELAGFYGHRGEAEKSLEWTKKAADTGHPEALFNLGIFQAFGAGGLKANRAEAVKLYQRAAEAGYDPAYIQLALASAGDGEFAQARRHLEAGKRVGLPVAQIKAVTARIDKGERAKAEAAQEEKRREEELQKAKEAERQACSHVYVGKTYQAQGRVGGIFAYDVTLQCTVIGFSSANQRVSVECSEKYSHKRIRDEVSCFDVPR